VDKAVLVAEAVEVPTDTAVERVVSLQMQPQEHQIQVAVVEVQTQRTLVPEGVALE
jgi:hypothetical protein